MPLSARCAPSTRSRKRRERGMADITDIVERLRMLAEAYPVEVFTPLLCGAMVPERRRQKNERPLPKPPEHPRPCRLWAVIADKRTVKQSLTVGDRKPG